MFNFFIILMLAGMIVTVASLFTGLFVMAKNKGKSNDKAQLLMRIRVYAQGFAVLSLVCALLVY